MARGTSIVLASQTFTTKGNAVTFFKALLGRYRVGQGLEAADANTLYELLLRHPEAETKIGVGIQAFSVMMTEHGTPCFRIHRHDGSGTDFSYRQAIDGQPRAVKNQVQRAFRHAIREDIHALRNRLFGDCASGTGTVPCARTGTTLTRDTCHIDHAPPLTFERIVLDYLAANGLTYETVSISHGADDQVQTVLTNTDLARHFLAHHRAIAQLIPIEKRLNLAQSSQHRIRDAAPTPERQPHDLFGTPY